jgi:O-antigen/teichoic acid export membrane protein
LGTVPGARLTRTLRFDRLAWAEMGSLLAGQGTAVLVALSGGGLWALAGGALATTLAGTALVNLFAPWRPRLGLTREAAARLLRFGLPYQGQGLLHLLKDRLIPALGGLALGAGPVGYLTWAQDLARWPRLPADYAARIGFPALARLQHDPAGLAQTLQQTLAWALTLSAAVSAAALALGPALVVPIFGAQWAPAAGPLLIFLAQTPLDALAALLLPVIYAAGQAGRGLRLSAAWVGLTWLLCTLALAAWPDLRAIPLGFALATLCAVLLIARSLPPAARVDWRRAVGVPAVVGGVVYAGVEIVMRLAL